LQEKFFVLVRGKVIDVIEGLGDVWILIREHYAVGHDRRRGIRSRLKEG